MTVDRIEQIIEAILMKDGPDGHADGAGIITQFIVMLRRGDHAAEEWYERYQQGIGQQLPSPEVLDPPFLLQLQEVFITLCQTIRECNLVADTGPVRRTRKYTLLPHAQVLALAASPDRAEQIGSQSLGPTTHFALGVGKGTAVLYYLIPIERWEDCYFATETDVIVHMNCLTSEERLEKIKALMG